MPMLRLVLLVLLVALTVTPICTAPYANAADSHRNVKVIELQQTEVALRETYPHKGRMGVPRLVMLNADGRVLYGGMGLPSDLAQRLHIAWRKSEVLDSPITLERILAETQRADGRPIAVSDLPKADIYIVDYWAGWCAPCRMLARDLSSIMGRWDDKQFVWLKIESDPEKLPDRH